MIILQTAVSLADPHICSDARNRLNLLTAIFDALVQRDDHGRFVPALATHWHLADDAHTWTFTLRDDVVFHNGATLTPADVVASLRRACDPSVGGEFGTEGVWASYLGDAEMAVAGETAVCITTSRPMADLLDLLVAIPIVPQNALADLPHRLVGSGPYQLVAHGENEVVLEPFPHCRTRWTAAHPRLVWRGEPDAAQRLAALLSGKADLVMDLSQQQANAVEAAGGKKLAQSSNLCVAFLFNIQHSPATDKRVRQAINYAVNVERMIDLARPAASPLNGPLTPYHFGCDPWLAPYPYDPVKAQMLLAEVGFSGKLVIDVPQTLPDEAPLLGELLVENLTAVNLPIELRHYTDRVAYAHMVKAKQIHDACCFDSSPLSTYRVLREKLNSDTAGPWWQGYHNPQVNQLLDQASRTVNPTQRQSIYRTAYRLLHDDAPWLFLYHPTYFWGASQQVGTIPTTPEGLIRL